MISKLTNQFLQNDLTQQQQQQQETSVVLIITPQISHKPKLFFFFLWRHQSSITDADDFSK